VTDESAGHVAHHNVTILTTEDAATLEALLVRPEIRSLVWKRLDKTRALVDTARVQTLARRLRDLGHSPRFSSLIP
jgi:hypothetical protein